MKLSRKKIILGIFILILIVLGVWFFIFLNTQEKEDIIDTTKNLFPFGEINQGSGGFGNGNQGTIGGDVSGTNQETGTEEFIEETPRLRQVSDFPTGGFTPIIRIEVEDVIEIDVDDEGNETQTFRTVEVENQYIRYSSIKDASIYESEITPSTLTGELLINNFVPNSEFAYFNNTGENVIFQYWNAQDRSPESYLAKIEKLEMKVDPCPFSFEPIELGEDSSRVVEIHQFLNRNPQTRIARTGINSPGNESSLAIETTITAIKNFQSLYQIDIDGGIGPETKGKMLEVCNEQQIDIAEKEFEKLDPKYKLSGFFLPQNITSISINPNGEEFFYIKEDSVGVIGIVRNLINGTKKTVFESPFTEWITQWNNDESIELTTKPSYQTESYSYQLNPNTERYFKSFKEKKGLTTLPSPDNSKVLITEALDSSIRMSIYERKSNKFRPLLIQTFSEKCVWSENNIDIYCAVPDALAYGNQYPDIWYQGLETYNDSLWKINSRTRKETVLSDILTEYNTSLDIEKIAIDPKDEYLYFIDKNTEFLWSYRLVDF